MENQNPLPSDYFNHCLLIQTIQSPCSYLTGQLLPPHHRPSVVPSQLSSHAWHARESGIKVVNMKYFKLTPVSGTQSLLSTEYLEKTVFRRKGVRCRFDTSRKYSFGIDGRHWQLYKEPKTEWSQGALSWITVNCGVIMRLIQQMKKN